MCGIAAAYLKDRSKNVAGMLYGMLVSQENRMNYSAGINVYRSDRENDFLITQEIGVGPIDKAFGLESERKARLGGLEGYAGIAQGRYATSNANRQFTTGQKERMAQPSRNITDKLATTFSFAFNGNIANFQDLFDELRGPKQGYHIRTRTDTEVLRILIKKGISKALKVTGKPILDQEAFKDIFAELSEKVIGAYSLVFLDATGNLILARDKEGTRPLVYTVEDFGLLAASEPTAFTDLGLKGPFFDVEPGHIVMMDGQNTLSEQIQFAAPKRAHCGFEFQYFSNITSTYDGINVQKVRRAQGRAFAYHPLLKDMEFTTRDLVIGIPETAREFVGGFIEGWVEQGKLPPAPLEMLFKRKQYRNFMEDQPADRKEKVKHKFRITEGIAKGKRLWVFDDSYVRGDVLQGLIPMIKEAAQPDEIHALIAWDQFRHPCYRGIDVPHASQLLSTQFSGDLDRIREHLGLTSLTHLPIETTRQLLAENSSGKLTIDDFCTACSDGNYPTQYEKEQAGLIPAARLVRR